MTLNNYQDDVMIADDYASPEAYQHTAYGKALAAARPTLKGHAISFSDQQPTKKARSDNHSVSSVMSRLFNAGATRLGRTPVQAV